MIKNSCLYIKNVIYLVLFLLFHDATLNAQFSKPILSGGLQRANFRTIQDDWNTGAHWRTGWWSTLHSEYRMYPWFSVGVGITYQERKALETFSFSFGANTTSTRHTLSDYPTSPQHPDFYNPDKHYIHFPNFKYLDVEVIPTARLGKKIIFKMGSGVFGGVLLNPQSAKVTQQELPDVQFIFQEPFNVFGEVTYHPFDLGWIPMLAIEYPISKHLKLGITYKSYQSVIRLNDNFVWPFRYNEQNMRWVSHLLGVSLTY